MEQVVVLAILVLVVVFVGSLIALLVICYHRYLRHPNNLLLNDRNTGDTHPILKYSKDRLNDVLAGSAANDDIDDVHQLSPQIGLLFI